MSLRAGSARPAEGSATEAQGVSMADEFVVPIGFADSELESYRRVGANIVVEIRAWNGQHVEVSFNDVISLRDSLAGSFCDLVRDAPGSAGFWNEALARNFETVPESHPFHVYSFLSLEGAPSLEVVAARCAFKVE